jgi:hypothetical protein
MMRSFHATFGVATVAPWCRTLLLIASLGIGIGCGAPLRDASRQATAGALDQALDTFEDARMRQRVAAFLATPEAQQTLREAAAGLAAGFAEGSIETLSEDDKVRQRLVMLSSLVASTATRAAMESAVEEASSPETTRRLQGIAVGTATLATRAAMQEMNSDLVSMMGTLGPAIRATMTDDVEPGVHELLNSSEVRSALAAAAFEMSRQAVLGSNEGLAELEQKRRKTGLLARLSGAFASATWLLPLFLAVCAATIVTLTMGLFRMRSRIRALGRRNPDDSDALPGTAARRHLRYRRDRFGQGHPVGRIPAQGQAMRRNAAQSGNGTEGA